jgi:hypothetical protein
MGLLISLFQMVNLEPDLRGPGPELLFLEVMVAMVLCTEESRSLTWEQEVFLLV